MQRLNKANGNYVIILYHRVAGWRNGGAIAALADYEKISIQTNSFK
jgi:hypothetical protein